jgi:hypothetical protein
VSHQGAFPAPAAFPDTRTHLSSPQYNTSREICGTGENAVKQVFLSIDFLGKSPALGNVSGANREYRYKPEGLWRRHPERCRKCEAKNEEFSNSLKNRVFTRGLLAGSYFLWDCRSTTQKKST